MSRLLQLRIVPRGTLHKNEAIDYVGGPDFFRELERDHGLRPCRNVGTRILYRVAELDRCLEAAERELNA